MKFAIASLILFLGMYALAAQDELEAMLEKSTCNIVDLRGQPIKAKCDGFAQSPDKKTTKELDNKVSALSTDDELDVE
jgi:hypothetical protein